MNDKITKENILFLAKTVMRLLKEHEDKNQIRFKYDEDPPFIYRILVKKLEAYDIDIKLPIEVTLLIDLCILSNPGLSQIVLKDILMRSDNVCTGYIVNSDDISYLDKILKENVTDEGLTEYYRQYWYDHKINGMNGCDTKEWWLEVFDENKRKEYRERYALD